MVLPLVVVLLQAAQTPAQAPASDAKPVRVWLDANSPLYRGSAVRVYVAAHQDGNLVVLHRSTEGHIDVLFPARPTEDPFVQAGTYEIRGPNNRAGLVVAEPDGTGMILAALSADPLRFNEFVHLAAWNPDALVPTWSGADGEGVLSDIVQRMLGDGSFNYDLVTYTVAPPVYAQQDSGVVGDSAARYAAYPPCPDCSDLGQEFILVGPGRFCGVFFADCFGGRRFRRPDARCDAFSSCSEPPSHGIAYVGPRTLGARPAPSTGTAAASSAAPAAVLRRRSPAAPSGVPIVPRGRAPVPATPLVPGRRPTGGATPPSAIATRGVAGRGNQRTGRGPVALSDAPISHVRFTLVSAPVGDEPRAGASYGAAPLDAVARGGEGRSGRVGGSEAGMPAGGGAAARGAAPRAVTGARPGARGNPAQAAHGRLGPIPFGPAPTRAHGGPVASLVRPSAGSGPHASGVQMAARGASGSRAR